jgi:hypothetical protein
LALADGAAATGLVIAALAGATCFTSSPMACHPMAETINETVIMEIFICFAFLTSILFPATTVPFVLTRTIRGRPPLHFNLHDATAQIARFFPR